jgi:hypothetical protein
MSPLFCYVLHQTSITLGMIFFFERILGPYVSGI